MISRSRSRRSLPTATRYLSDFIQSLMLRGEGRVARLDMRLTNNSRCRRSWTSPRKSDRGAASLAHVQKPEHAALELRSPSWWIWSTSSAPTRAGGARLDESRCHQV